MLSTISAGLTHTAHDMWHTVQAHPVMTTGLVVGAAALIHRWEQREWHRPVQQWTARFSARVATLVPANLGMGLMMGALAIAGARMVYHAGDSASSHFLHAVGTFTIGAGMLVVVRGLHAVAHYSQGTRIAGATRVFAGIASAACIAEDLLPALQVAKPVAVWINAAANHLWG